MRRAPVSSAARSSWLARYRLPILSAIALNLTFHPWSAEGLVWVALVPLFVWLADPALTPPQAFKGLLLTGAVYHFGLLAPFLSLGWWAWGSTTEDGVRHYFLYTRIFMAMIVAGITLLGGLVMGLTGSLMRPYLRRPALALLVVPSVWVVVLEWLGHGLVFGFGWGLIGNRVGGHEALRQAARAVGVYGLSALVLMVNAALASLWIMARRPAAERRWMGPAGAALAVAACLAWGLADGSRRLAEIARWPAPLQVALLQGVREDYTVDDFTPDGLDRIYSELISEARAEHPDLMVLPETAWFRTLQLDGTTSPWTQPEALTTPEALRQGFARLLHDDPALVVLGIDAVSGGRTYNTTTVWSRERLEGVYRKRRLVPFAEYRPAIVGVFAPQNVVHGLAFSYTPGEGTQLFRAGGLALGPFICQEVMYPALVRETVRDGAELLVTTGNDGVFKSPVVAREMARLAVLRAVENGRFLLRSMKTGVSAVIDPAGRVLASAPVGGRAIVRGRAGAVTQQTPYTRFGNWIVGLAACIVVASVTSTFRTR